MCGKHRVSSVNKLRNNKISVQKLEREKKMLDLSLLLLFPSCEANVKYHIMRAEYVALIFRNDNQLIFNLEDPINHDWNERIRVKWKRLLSR